MKRFIDTEMMLRPWFRSLEPRLKCLWLWMLTRCDMAGVLDMDWGLVSFAIGEECTECDLAAMNGNVEILSGTKVWLPGFIRFQYGELKDASPVHRGVYKALALHGIEYQKAIERLSGLSNSPKDKDKDKDKAKEKDKRDAMAQPDSIKSDFDEAWKAYPSKAGSKTISEKAYRRFRAEGDTQADILTGIERYKAYVAQQRSQGQELAYRNGQTFFNQANWRDEWAVEKMPPVEKQQPTKPKQNFGPTFNDY